jgi:hypothetical protein
MSSEQWPGLGSFPKDKDQEAFSLALLAGELFWFGLADIGETWWNACSERTL